jgi:hypothetical protein
MLGHAPVKSDRGWFAVFPFDLRCEPNGGAIQSVAETTAVMRFIR